MGDPKEKKKTEEKDSREPGKSSLRHPRPGHKGMPTGFPLLQGPMATVGILPPHSCDPYQDEVGGLRSLTAVPS